MFKPIFVKPSTLKERHLEIANESAAKWIVKKWRTLKADHDFAKLGYCH